MIELNFETLNNANFTLYKNNPVKKDIAGTIESISEIDSELLYKCYNTFYNLSNMTLFVTGDFEPEKILSVIEESILKNEPFDEEIKRIYLKYRQIFMII